MNLCFLCIFYPLVLVLEKPRFINVVYVVDIFYGIDHFLNVKKIFTLGMGVLLSMWYPATLTTLGGRLCAGAMDGWVLASNMDILETATLCGGRSTPLARAREEKCDS